MLGSLGVEGEHGQCVAHPLPVLAGAGERRNAQLILSLEDFRS